MLEIRLFGCHVENFVQHKTSWIQCKVPTHRPTSALLSAHNRTFDTGRLVPGIMKGCDYHNQTLLNTLL